MRVAQQTVRREPAPVVRLPPVRARAVRAAAVVREWTLPHALAASPVAAAGGAGRPDLRPVRGVRTLLGRRRLGVVRGTGAPVGLRPGGLDALPRPGAAGMGAVVDRRPAVPAGPER